MQPGTGPLTHTAHGVSQLDYMVTCAVCTRADGGDIHIHKKKSQVSPGVGSQRGQASLLPGFMPEDAPLLPLPRPPQVCRGPALRSQVLCPKQHPPLASALGSVAEWPVPGVALGLPQAGASQPLKPLPGLGRCSLAGPDRHVAWLPLPPSTTKTVFCSLLASVRLSQQAPHGQQRGGVQDELPQHLLHD